jgi:predicted AAA+ superfamily ATPase
MATYRHRLVDELVHESLDTFGAVIIEGPRAVGKTTTGLQMAKSSVRLDAEPQLPAIAETSPGIVLAGLTPRLIDEWQLAPTLWNAVRHEVDKRSLPGQFILTGSTTPPDDITRHSGAGRFRRVILRPMTLSESGESTGSVSFAGLFAQGTVAGIGGPTVEDYAKLLVRGGWPALVAQSRRSPQDYLRSYLDDVARVDLPGVELRSDPLRVRALIRALARNTSTEISVARLSQEAEIGKAGTEVSAQTARKYIDALSRVFVVEEQPAWAPHLRSRIRLRTQPKWHFIDPSLAAAALDASPRALLDDLNTLGLLFESLCIRDLRVLAQQMGGTVYHYRDGSGLEVDAIVELANGQWAAFEVKMGGSKNIDDAAEHLQSLAKKVSEKRANQLASLNVLTAGSTSYARSDGVNVVSLGHLAP